MRGSLREIMKDIYDFERLLTRMEIGSANARDMNALKSSLRVLPSVKNSWRNFLLRFCRKSTAKFCSTMIW